LFQPSAALRQTFAADEQDRKKSNKFGGLLLSVAMEQYQASAYNPEFVCALLREVDALPKGADVRSWLFQRLKNSFLCVAERPVWIDEPQWPFLNGQSMVIIRQIPPTENRVTRNHLEWLATLYVFGARVPCENGFRIEYCIVEQRPD
jgi:hypothetical protein